MPTLAALVPGATAGLITEVLIADGGSHDDTAAVADVAGCNFLVVEGLLAGTAQGGCGGGARAVADVPAAGNRARRAVDRRSRTLSAARAARAKRPCFGAAARHRRCASSCARSRQRSAPRRAPSRACLIARTSITPSAAIPSVPTIPNMTSCAASAGGRSSNWPPRRSGQILDLVKYLAETSAMASRDRERSAANRIAQDRVAAVRALQPLLYAADRRLAQNLPRQPLFARRGARALRDRARRRADGKRDRPRARSRCRLSEPRAAQFRKARADPARGVGERRPAKPSDAVAARPQRLRAAGAAVAARYRSDARQA